MRGCRSRTGRESDTSRDRRLRNFVEFLGPAGFATPDDVEMLELCQRGYANMASAPYNDLSRGMATGAIPEADPRLLTRALLGLYNSVWHWYRSRGTLTLEDVAAFYVPRMLLIVGLEPPATLKAA